MKLKLYIYNHETCWMANIEIVKLVYRLAELSWGPL